MMLIRFLSLVLIATVALLSPADIVLAKGPPARVTITGPALADEIEVRGPELLQDLALARFEDFQSGAIEPPEVDEGYEITSYYRIGSGVQAWDRKVYHPDTSGGRGYVFYQGLINGWSEYDGRWFRVTAHGERAIRNILAANGVELSPSRSTRRVVPLAEWLQHYYTWRDGCEMERGEWRGENGELQH